MLLSLVVKAACTRNNAIYLFIYLYKNPKTAYHFRKGNEQLQHRFAPNPSKVVIQQSLTYISDNLNTIISEQGISMI